MHTYRWHPAIKATRHGPRVRSMPLHLLQSDLDGACGPHCALMALLLFGIIKRDDLSILHKVRKKPLSSFWRHAARNYFKGTSAHHLKAALKPYAHDLFCSVRQVNCINHVLEVLNISGVGIVGIESTDFSHWVLAIGIGGTEGRRGLRSATLLILDPSHAPIPLSPWNAMLSVKADRKKRYAYETPNGRCRVTVDAALIIHRNT